MPRARGPNRDAAKELWLKSNKTRLLKDIAAELGEPENRIRKWKSEDKWDSETLPLAKRTKRSVLKRNAPNQKPSKKPVGAQVGNENAVGNRGGAPIGNQNALKHGGYSPVYWDALDDTERELLATISTNEEKLLEDQIYLFSLRERRIMLAIQKYTDLKDERGRSQNLAISAITATTTKREFDNTDLGKDEMALYTLLKRHKMAEQKISSLGRDVTTNTSTEATINIVQRLENELTRVQRAKTQCIDTLNKIRQSGKESKGNSMADDWIAALTGGDEDE